MWLLLKGNVRQQFKATLQGGCNIARKKIATLPRRVIRFCAGSNPARGVSEIHNGEDLTMVPVGNKAKRLSLVNDTTKTIHHHEVHGKVKLVKGQKKLTFSATQKEPSKKKEKAIMEKI